MCAQNADKHSGLLLSVEGISGCGKTYFLTQLRKRLPDNCFVTEVSDRTQTQLDTYILSALRSRQDPFFQTGHPRTETALLVALKTFDFESVIEPALQRNMIVWEDRSIDTIAVYQAILCDQQHPERWLAGAQRIYESATLFRPPPTRTLLITDSFRIAVNRAEERSQQQYTREHLWLLESVAQLYVRYAAVHSQRIAILDRRKMSNECILNALVNTARQHVCSL
jgi:thymidylate kinase